MFADAGTFVSSRFSVKSSNHSGRSCKRSPAAPLVVSIFILVVSFGGLRQFPNTPSLLRKFAGINELDKSCANDVEDEHALELDDNPGTTTGTTFSVLHGNVFPIFGRMWLLTTGPLICVSVLFVELT